MSPHVAGDVMPDCTLGSIHRADLAPVTTNRATSASFPDPPPFRRRLVKHLPRHPRFQCHWTRVIRIWTGFESEPFVAVWPVDLLVAIGLVIEPRSIEICRDLPKSSKITRPGPSVLILEDRACSETGQKYYGFTWKHLRRCPLRQRYEAIDIDTT